MAPTGAEVDFIDDDPDTDTLIVVLDVEIVLEVEFDEETPVLGFVVLKRM